MTHASTPRKKRKLKGPKFLGKEGEWYKTQFREPLRLLPLDEREEIKYLVPDEDIAKHKFGCACAPCKAHPDPGKVRRKALAAARAAKARRQQKLAPDQK